MNNDRHIALSLTVIILTFNEEIHIERCIKSVCGFASRILVVDSFSSDRTRDLALQHGAEVITHRFVNQAKQFAWALEHTNITSEWVMRLDADEIVEESLASEIQVALPAAPSLVTGFNLRRKHFWMGRWIRFGGRYPLFLLRIWRNGLGTIEERWMDEHIVVRSGTVVTLKGDFADVNLNTLSYFIRKHDSYASREAIEILSVRLSLFSLTAPSAKLPSCQASIKRWIKLHIFNRIHFSVSSAAYFLWRYIFLFGFLDGIQGLTYHFLQGFWYRFLVGCKLIEMEKAIAGIADREEMIYVLSKLSGLDLASDHTD